MIKRPLAAAAILFLSIQAVLVCGFRQSQDLKPTKLEQQIPSSASVEVEGTVYRKEEKPGYKVLYVKDTIVRLKNQIYKEDKLLIYLDCAKAPAIGNRLRLSGEAKQFQTARNPGNFNQKAYYQTQKIHLFVWADTAKIVDGKEHKVREALSQLRVAWKSLLVKTLGDYYGNCMSAILLGDKSELDSEIKTLYQKSGIGHILAISGLHMSFLGSGLYQLLRKAKCPFFVAGGIGILFLTLYTLMIGCGVSSLRALAMFFVRMGADITGRDYDLPTSLAVAAAVITAWQPLYLKDAGFLLSFGALVGITAVTPCFEFLLFKGKKSQSWQKNICSSLAVNITLLPLMLYFYYEYPPYSLFLNLLIIPLMTVVLAAGVIGSGLYVLSSFLGGTVLILCKLVLGIYEKACKISLWLPKSRIITGQPQLKWIYLYYITLLLFCIVVYTCIQSERKRAVLGKQQVKISQNRQKYDCRIKFASGIFIILILSLGIGISCKTNQVSKGQLSVTMLDVGQGDGLYVRGPTGKNYFIDGGSSDVSSVGTYRIEPFLKSKGVGRLDYVFISHGDADHISGIEEMLGSQKMGIRIDTLVLPPMELWDETLQALAAQAKNADTRVVTIQQGKAMEEQDLQIRCLAPSNEYQGETGNAASVVLELTFGQFEMLFTGDVEGEGEKELTKQGNLKKYDILKVAHHGSKNSTLDEFLSLTSPEIAWISAGIDNRYGHPHKETLERLQQYESKLYSTQNDKAVTVCTDKKKLWIETFAETVE